VYVKVIGSNSRSQKQRTGHASLTKYTHLHVVHLQLKTMLLMLTKQLFIFITGLVINIQGKVENLDEDEILCHLVNETDTSLEDT